MSINNQLIMFVINIDNMKLFNKHLISIFRKLNWWNSAFLGMPTAQILNQAAGKQLYSVVGAGRISSVF